MTEVTRDPVPWSFVSSPEKLTEGLASNPELYLFQEGPMENSLEGAGKRARGFYMLWVKPLKVCGPELPEPSPFSLAPPCPQLLVTPLSPGGASLEERRSHSAGRMGFPWVGRGQAAAVGAISDIAATGPSLGPWRSHILYRAPELQMPPRGAGSVDEGRGGLGSTWFSLVLGWLRNSWGYVDRF